MSRPKILIARATFDEIPTYLSRYFEVQSNQADIGWTPATLAAALADKDGVITNLTEPINAQLLAQTPRLKAVCNNAVGYNNLDMAALTAAGVIATNTPDVLTETTADMAWALLMATARRISEAEDWLRAGHWQQFRFDSFLGQDVHGATLGIIGMGRIGQAIARRAQGFNMQVLYHNRSQLAAPLEQQLHATYVDKATLLREADHVLLVLPYSAESHHTIGAAELAQMKPTATLINIARGGIVDDAALANALRTGQIAAAGLDVFENEPQVQPALLAVSNIVLTPHIASATQVTRMKMIKLATDNLIAALGFGPQAGQPPCILNPAVLAQNRTTPRA
ncbi:2-hydroxyacid dehydrogenase [Ampullimonas aquatilis]|uniref:2-hydroxyacid dehydrogenase n=1 Tax=Ampullimonas aquatilis TaxID=1341549 RepID=UPI003C74785D